MAGTFSVTKQLFVRCAAGFAPACEEAFEAVRPVLQKIARRLAFQFGSYDESEDLLQEIYLKLTANRENLAGALPDEEAAVHAYISVLAANVGRDWYRSRGAEKRGLKVTRVLDESLNGLAKFLGVEPKYERDLFLDQVEQALPGEDRDRVIFRLYYRQGFTAKEIGDIPALGLTTKGVESLILRLSRELKQRLNQTAGKSTATTS